MVAYSAVGRKKSSWPKQQSPSKQAFCLTLLIAINLTLLACEVQGQFFTKSNSKSIPRMGRRSLPDSSNKLELFRRLMIDRLVDEFGPSLLGQLRPEIKLNPEAAGAPQPSGGGGGELYMRNEQPFDFNPRPMAGESQQQLVVLDSGPESMSRDERAASGAGGSEGDSPVSKQSYRHAKSLAMRAFNADRLLQHLASGGTPLGAYDRLLESKEQRANNFQD